LKGQSGTKLLVKPTWSEKMTVLRKVLESSLNFLSNNLTIRTKLVQSGRTEGVKVQTARHRV